MRLSSSPPPAPIRQPMTRPLRIALIANEFPSPSETFIFNHVGALLAAGHQVTVFAGRPPASADASLVQLAASPGQLVLHRWPKVPSSPLRRVALAPWAAVRALAEGPSRLIAALHFSRYPGLAKNLRLIYTAALPSVPSPEQLNFDIVHAHFGLSAGIDDYLRQTGILSGPLVIAFHGVDATSHPSRYGMAGLDRHFARAAAVTANSSFTASRLVAIGCPVEKISIIPEYVDLHRFPFQPRSWDGSSALQLVSVGRLVEKKGFLFALEAIALLQAEGLSLHYHIAGDGPLLDDLLKASHDLGIDHLVTFHGWCQPDQIRTLFDRAHLMVVPSVTATNGDMEGQGVVIQEAQAAGLPVVATDHNGFPESLLPGQSGILVPEADPVSLASAIRQLLDGHSTWPAMGEAGRRHVIDRFSPERTTQTILDLYSSITANGTTVA
jgi:colanic acid/amylovoran biosynthesis glycosyltransferase